MKFEGILVKFEERKQKWLRQVQDAKTELEYNGTQTVCNEIDLQLVLIPRSWKFGEASSGGKPTVGHRQGAKSLSRRGLADEYRAREPLARNRVFEAEDC